MSTRRTSTARSVLVAAALCVSAQALAAPPPATITAFDFEAEDCHGKAVQAYNGGSPLPETACQSYKQDMYENIEYDPPTGPISGAKDRSAACADIEFFRVSTLDSTWFYFEYDMVGEITPADCSSLNVEMELDYAGDGLTGSNAGVGIPELYVQGLPANCTVGPGWTDGPDALGFQAFLDDNNDMGGANPRVGTECDLGTYPSGCSDYPTGSDAYEVDLGKAADQIYCRRVSGSLDKLQIAIRREFNTEKGPDQTIANPVAIRPFSNQQSSIGKDKMFWHDHHAISDLGGERVDNVGSVNLVGEPSIDIEKATNGSDADSSPGPSVRVGDPVTWTYLVTNSGSTVLTGIAVTDDVLGAITCPETALDVGEHMTCTAPAGTAVAGQYSNLGSVVGYGPGTVEVTDSDPSHYYGIDPSIDIEKDTNGFDADTQPGPSIAVGAGITWTYVVTNDGDTLLTNIAVSDVPAATITCPGGNPIPSLAAAASVSCTASGTAALGQFANTATATGSSSLGTDDVTDSDPSHYFGTAPDIQIVKTGSPQTYGAAGTLITYTLAVTNTGNVTLTSVAITDQSLTGLSAVDCAPEAHPIADLAPGETVECSATYTTDADDVTAGQVDNTAQVTGQCTVTNCPVSDTDDETVTSTAEAAVTITKTASPKTYTGTGQAITYTFLVTNSGATTLYDVAVTDETGLPGLSAITCTGEANPIADMAPAESVSCTASYSTVAADILTPFKVDNTAKAEGYPCESVPDEGYPCSSIDDTDDETINAILINLTKTVTSGPTYNPVTGRYTVVYDITATNTGSAPGVYDVVDDGFTQLAAGISLYGTPVVSYVAGTDSLDAANNPPGWPTIADDENIGANGATESWRVTAEFELNPASLGSDARDCNESDAEAGKGFYNSVLTFTGETNTDDNDDCVDLPDPDLDLSKVVETTENIGLDKFRVTYLVKVDNTGDGPGIYNINDVPGFGAGITLDGTPTVTYVAMDDLFTPTPVTAPAWTQIALNETISGQSSEAWRVVAEFDIDLTHADYALNRECVTDEGGWVSGKGFFNSVELERYTESNTLNNKACSDPDDPLINLAKTAEPAVILGEGLYDVTYTFTAENQSTVYASYDLVDTLMPGLALTPIAIQVPTAYVAGTENDQDGVIQSPVIADFTTGAILVTGETLAAGATESWSITIRFQLDYDLVTAENSDCVDNEGEEGYTGFNNYVEGSLTEVDFSDNEDCVELPPDTIAVPVNSQWALILMIMALLATGWYFRPAVMRQ